MMSVKRKKVVRKPRQLQRPKNEIAWSKPEIPATPKEITRQEEDHNRAYDARQLQRSVLGSIDELTHTLRNTSASLHDKAVASDALNALIEQYKSLRSL